MQPAANPLVSVIIPCYNVADYITDCVNSVKSQTYSNLEIICIDNGSSDATADVLRELSAGTPGLIVGEESKKGANAARNKGLALSRGEWLQFLDADDLLLPGKLSHQLSLAASRNIAYIAGAYMRRSSKGEERPGNELLEDPFTGPFCNRHGITSSNLWNRQALAAAGGFDESLMSSQETDLMFRLVLAGGQCIVDREVNTIVRERASGQISSSDPEKRWTQYVSVRCNYLERIRTHYPDAFRRTRGILYDFLVVSLITLARYDSEKANRYYQRCVRSGWRPGKNFGMTPVKGVLLRAMGFKRYVSLFGN